MNLFENFFINLFFPSLVTAILSILLVLTKRWHGKHSCDSIIGVQKFHTCQTPRIGGISIFCGLIVVWLLSPVSEAKILGYLIIASIPAFVAGLTEDFTKKIGVFTRLIATMVSGLIACWITGYSLTHIDIPGIDALLSLPFLSVAFTVFAVAGVANATNIIDGFNGLSAGTLIICFSAFAFIAWQTGDIDLARLCVVLIAVTVGFIVVNFPFGKIFMGDGGAYLLGFMLGWIAVMLPMRNSSVSVWAPLLVCAYPVMETGFSMWRRHHRSGQHPGQADSLHLHSLVYCRVVKRVFRRATPQLKNSLTSLFIWPIPLLSSLIATISYSNTLVMMVSIIVCGFIYRLIYLRLTQFVWCLKPVTVKHS